MLLTVILVIFGIDSNYVAIQPDYKTNYTIEETINPISGPDTEYPWCEHVRCPNCGEACIMYNGELYNYEHLWGFIDKQTTKHVCTITPIGDIPVYSLIALLSCLVIVISIHNLNKDGTRHLV
jgi:hypothetical protein